MSKDVFVDKMEERILKFYDDKGILQTMPIIGMFSLKDKYYLVLYSEPPTKDIKGELVMVIVETDADGNDHVQLITDRDEWNEAYETWNAIIDEAMRKGII